MIPLTTQNILVGDVREQLKLLPSNHFHTCVTSPPYWGLRDYGTGTWEGRDGGCDHLMPLGHLNADFNARWGHGEGEKKQEACKRQQYKDNCPDCGARRVDQQIGSEATPAEFIRVMVEVFEEVKRVLRPDGTLWLNMGDSYATSPNGRKARDIVGDDRTFRDKPFSTVGNGFKAKDKMLMPHRLAIALCDAGWWIRQDICWSKPNPLPSSVTDRPGDAHEYIFLLTKSARYYYDHDAVRVKTGREANPLEYEQIKEATKDWSIGEDDTAARLRHGLTKNSSNFTHPQGRGLRSVWTLPTEPVEFAHFACFPSAIPRTAILAGTSAAGRCSECGAPWVRITDGASYYHSLSPEEKTSKKKKINQVGNGHGGLGRGPKTDLGCSISRTLGFSPSCSCNAGIRPCIVLDPFLGSGTSLMIARRLGRDGVGIELNPEYAKIAQRRIDGALCHEKPKSPTPGQLSIFEEVTP